MAASVVAQACAGDENAFARIVNAYHGDLMRVAYVVAGDQQTAEDAVQSTWSIAWRKLGSLRDPDRLHQWLVSVAANEARQLVRKQHRHPVIQIDISGRPSAADDPADAIGRIDLVNALAHLRPDDRVLLSLRYVAGLDSIEIGQLMGMSPSGVRGHLSRLNDRLRKELDDD
jgi:RNA polymerase sigma-70 factor (ECF subfamily)